MKLSWTLAATFAYIVAVLASVLLLVWCLLLRAPTLLRSVVDWDESVYLLMADQWNEGHVPYTTVWDHKPVGAYVLVKLALQIFGRNLLAMRALSALFVFLAARLIWAITARLTGHRAPALLAAFAYPAFTLLLGGTAANTEHYFIVFNLLGAWLLLRCYQTDPAGGLRLAHVAGAGLAFGLAFQVKYLALPESLLFGATYLYLESRRAGSRAVLAQAGLALACAALPSLLVFGYFAHEHAWAAFVDANFTANTRHVRGLDITKMVGSLIDWFRATAVIWLTVAIAWLAPIASAGDRAKWRKPALLLAAWVAVTLLESFSTGKFYDHYYLPTFAPLCVALGLMTSLLGVSDERARLGLVYGGLIALLPLSETIKLQYRPWSRERQSFGGMDPQALIASKLNAHLRGGDHIFVGSGEPILYFLVHSRLPTKFVFPPFLLDPHFSTVANVDYQAEFRRVLAGAPRCIVARRSGAPREQELTAMIGHEYVAEPVTPDTDILCRAN